MLQPHPSYHLRFIALIISGEEYKLWSSWLRSFPHPPFTSSLLGSKILLGTLFSTLPLILEPKLHKHTKQQAKLSFCMFYNVLNRGQKDKRLNWKIANVPRILSTPNIFYLGYAVAYLVKAGRSRVRFSIRSLDFSFDLTNLSSRTMGPGVDSASNRNEYEESSWG
jgi:hypothetical protein